MNYFATLKRSAEDFLREWGTFLNFSVLSALLMYFVGNLSWSFIVVFVFGLYLARGLAYDTLQKWSVKNFPGTEGGLSPVYPRVWTLELRLTKTLIEEVTAKMSGEKDSLLAHSLSNDDEFSTKIVIDEYVNRVRVHRWLVSESNGSRYDWFDIDKSSGTHWNFGETKHYRGCSLWTYATEAMTDGELTLSCSWERDKTTKRPYFQLILWVRYWEAPKEIPPGNVIFKIPLEPGRLCDEQGIRVAVLGQGGRRFKAGDLELFPNDDYDWKSDKDKGSHFSWHLHMQTFHTYIYGLA